MEPKEQEKRPVRQLKNRDLRIRVTEEEHAAFHRMAKELGYSTVSDFVRSLIAEDLMKEKK